MSSDMTPATDTRSTFLRDLVAAWNTHDPDRIVSFYAANFAGIDVAQSGPQQGSDAIREALRRYLQAFPDLRLSVENIINGADQSVIVWNAQGTHHGPLMNIPPTRRAVTVRGVTVLRIADQKIVNAFSLWDLAGLLRSLGLLPDL